MQFRNNEMDERVHLVTVEDLVRLSVELNKHDVLMCDTNYRVRLGSMFAAEQIVDIHNITESVLVGKIDKIEGNMQALWLLAEQSPIAISDDVELKHRVPLRCVLAANPRFVVKDRPKMIRNSIYTTNGMRFYEQNGWWARWASQYRIALEGDVSFYSAMNAASKALSTDVGRIFVVTCVPKYLFRHGMQSRRPSVKSMYKIGISQNIHAQQSRGIAIFAAVLANDELY
jgi:hypothetical protein